MLHLDTATAKPVANVGPGALVLYGVDSRRYVGLCVRAALDPNAPKALLLFGYRDRERTFPALYWPNVAEQGCIELGPAIIAADAGRLLAAPPVQEVVAGALSASPSGWTITAEITNGFRNLGAWELGTGNLAAQMPNPQQRVSGWVLGVAGIDGKFVPLVPDPHTPPQQQAAPDQQKWTRP